MGEFHFGRELIDAGGLVVLPCTWDKKDRNRKMEFEKVFLLRKTGSMAIFKWLVSVECRCRRVQSTL